MGRVQRATRATYADEQAWARRWVGGKLERDAALRKTVLGYLRQCWSPEQVAGHMARDAGGPVISHETIYRFIYGQVARTKDYSWRHYLPRGKAQTATPSAQWAQSGLLHCQAPSTGGTAAGGGRPPNPRPLGG